MAEQEPEQRLDEDKAVPACPVLVRINLVDCYASSTKVKIDREKTANDICEVLSTKLGLSDTDAMFYSLVCVSKCVDKKSIHWVRTLKSTDHVLQVQADMEVKAVKRCKSEVIAETVTSCFYYKDIRSNPLDLDGEVSGNSSSDDEMEIPLNDLIYFGSGERRGFLQKRSSRDPNVWRRRLCILNDKLWCINVRKSIPWASCVKLNDTTVLEDRPDLKYTNTITLSGSGGQTLFFRTNAPLEKHRWREEIRERTLYGAENEVIMMAEMIITDEEEMGECQMQKCYLEVMHSPQVWGLIRKILDLTDDCVVKKEELNFDCDGEDRNEGNLIDSPVLNRGRALTENRSPSPPKPVLRHHLQQSAGSRRRSRSLRVDSTGSIRGVDSDFRSKMTRAVPVPPQDPFLSKKIGRWPYQIFHILHRAYPACAAGVSLVCAVQHFKGAFRHDFYIRPKELWGNALHVYIHYILPYMDFIKDSNPDEISADRVREESMDESEHLEVKREGRTADVRAPVVLSSSQHISMDKITQLHRALFSNIRKKRKKVHALSAAVSGDRSSSSSASYSSWFWSSTDKSGNNSRTSRGISGLEESGNGLISSGNDLYNTDYEVLDCSIRPDMHMYDGIVDAIYEKLKEVV